MPALWMLLIDCVCAVLLSYLTFTCLWFVGAIGHFINVVWLIDFIDFWGWGWHDLKSLSERMYRLGTNREESTESSYFWTVSVKTVYVKKGKGAYSSLWIGNPSQSYGASPAIWDHTVLPATWHRWTHVALTPAMQAITRFTYREGWKAELTLVLVIYRDGLPVRRQLPIQVLTTW